MDEDDLATLSNEFSSKTATTTSDNLAIVAVNFTFPAERQRNLVLSDTIEGRIFLVLDDKLKETAKTLGRVDEHGEVVEDLWPQMLGQLSKRLSYESLYAKAISDPELKRTHPELEQALSNASQARTVVYELIQDLDGYSHDDYQPFSDTSEEMDEIVRFVLTAAEEDGRSFHPEVNGNFVVFTTDNGEPLRFTTDRGVSLESENIDLLCLDHSLVIQFMQRFRDLSDDQIGIRVRSDDGRTGVLSISHVRTHGERGETRNHMLTMAMDDDVLRIPSWENKSNVSSSFNPRRRTSNHRSTC